jgi:hypothetical protein
MKFNSLYKKILEGETSREDRIKALKHLASNKDKWYSVSIWYNRYGEDECYFEKFNTRFDDRFIEEASREVEWFGGSVSDFTAEYSTPTWKAYGDGEGVLILCSHINSHEAHSQYTELIEQDFFLDLDDIWNEDNG